ncbi:UNVERIFIED_CONTAM: hypothetical protein GTU68_014606 [Idotea baltica]|nr:hypothetical protein [Idotea baltica]
MNVSMKEV